MISPRGIEIVISRSPGASNSSATAVTASVMMARGPGLIGRFADRDRQTRQRHRADPVTGPEGNAVSAFAPSYGGDDFGAMRHIGIVAGILDDTGAPAAVDLFTACKVEGRCLALGQADRDGGLCAVRQQGAERRRRAGSSAGAGGPAAPQFAIRLAGGGGVIRVSSSWGPSVGRSRGRANARDTCAGLMICRILV